MVALLDFILATLEKKKMLHSKGPFVGNVFKHPARCVINILKLIVIILQKLLPTKKVNIPLLCKCLPIFSHINIITIQKQEP